MKQVIISKITRMNKKMIRNKNFYLKKCDCILNLFYHMCLNFLHMILEN